MGRLQQIYSLTVLKTTSLKLQRQQGQAPSEGTRGEEAVLPLPGSPGCRSSLVSGCIPPIPASVFQFSPFLSVNVPSYKDTSHWTEGPP